MGLVTLPHNLVDGVDTALGTQVRANDQSILDQAVNGNITDVNIATGAAIQGSKLSNVAGSRVPTDRIEDDAVTFDKLSDHATIDASRAVGPNHIRNDAVIARAVKNGSIVAVRRDALVARLNIFGQTTQVTLRLQHDEE